MVRYFFAAVGRKIAGLVLLAFCAGSAQAQFDIIGLDNGVEGKITPPNVAAASEATDFGQGITGASEIKRTYKVINTSGASITVTSVSVSGAGYTIVSGNTGSFTLGSGLSAAYEVEFSPASNGLSTGLFSVKVGAATSSINIVGEGVAPPTLAKSFNPTSVEIGATSKMTLVVTAPAGLKVSQVVISDPFPAGIVVAPTPNATTNNCPPGILSATAGQGSAIFTQQTGNESEINGCTISIDVTSEVGGTYTNTASILGGALDGSITPPNSTIEGSANITFIGPDIDVEVGSTTVTDGQTGAAATITTPRGTPAAQVVTIKETGQAPLTISSISLSNSTDFQITGTPPTSVAKNGSATFNVQCLAAVVTAAPNHAETTVTVNSNAEGAENVFTFPLTCEVMALPPEVAVKGNGIDIAVGAQPAINTGTDFGTTALGATTTRSFRIEEVDGDTDLMISGTGITGTGFTISTNPDGTVAKGTGVDLGVQCSATSAGTITEKVYFTTTDTDDAETAYEFTVTCIVAAEPPEISVVNGATTVAVNSVQTISPGATANYIISNDAAAAPNGAALNISAIMSSDTANFSLSGVGTGPIAGGATTDFGLQCTATAPGTYETTISIDNNDTTGGENPYQFKARCIVDGEPPEINVSNSSSGGSISFASNTTLNSAINETITIQEEDGESNLRIDNVTVSNSAEFEVNNHPSLVAAGGTETFTLTCKAASIGTHTTTVTITHNDTDDGESPYTFAAQCVVENRIPIAVAKALDTNVSEGDTVTLDGTDSSDPDDANEMLTYAWTQNAGTGVNLSTATSAQPTFVAPTLTDNTPETLTFSLVVTDTKTGVSTNTATVNVTVNNKNAAPVADAGPDQTAGALAGTTVQLVGSGSTDPDMDTITYLWTAPAGVTLVTPTSQNPTFVAPTYTRDTTLEFTLVVNDGQLDSTSDVVKVLIKEGIKPTVAVADIPNPCTDISPIELAVNFSEDVVGLAAADFDITNATIISLNPGAGPATSYTLTIQPDAPNVTTVTYPVTIELPAGRVTDVAGNDNIALTSVTFTCAHDDYVNRRTRGVITNFMLDRATVMLAQEPQLIDQLQRVRRQNTAVDLTASFVEGQSARVEFSTSARQVIGFARQKRAEGRQYDGASTLNSARDRVDLDTDPRSDVWVRGHWGSTNNNDRKTSGGVIYFGGDYRVTDSSVLGALVQYDLFSSEDKQLGHSANGMGWMAGPYFAAKLFDSIYLDGRFAVGGSINEVSPFNTYEDKFGTVRGLMRMRATGEIQFDNWAIQPEASIYHFRESADSYVDSLGVKIPETKFSLTQIEVGPRVRGQFDLGEEDRMDVMVGFRGVYEAQGGNFANFTAGLNPDFREGFRGRVDAGIDWHGRFGSMTTELYYDGIGKQNFNSYGAKLRYQVPLQ